MKQIQKSFGKLISVSAFLIFLYEKLTSSISTMLCRLYCGKDCMKKVNDIVGDSSCHFNVDMYLSASFILLFILGMVISILADREKKHEKIYS